MGAPWPNLSDMALNEPNPGVIFPNIVNGFLQFTMVTKKSILDATGFLGLSLDWVPLKKA